MQFPCLRAGARARVVASRVHTPALLPAALFLLALHAGQALAADATILQSGHDGQVEIEQAASSGAVQVLQSGNRNTADIAQSGAFASRITVDQSGSGNDLFVRQSHGRTDTVEVTQGGNQNRAQLSQTAFGTSATQNLLLRR